MPFIIASCVLLIVVIVLALRLIQLRKRVSIYKAACSAHMQDAEEYKKAILHKAHSYFRVNITRNRMIPPIIEREFGELSDQSPNTTYQYDIFLTERSTQIITEGFRDEFVYVFSPANLMKNYQQGNLVVSYKFKCSTPFLGSHYRNFVCLLSKDRKTGDIMSINVAYEA